MMRRMSNAIAWIVAAVAVTVCGVQWAQAQRGLDGGVFVSAPDGSRWAVGNGAKVRLNFRLDDGNELGALRDAGQAGTLDEALAALGGAQPVVSGPPPSSPSTPADSLVGQRAHSCRFSDEYDWEVVRAVWTDNLPGVGDAGRGAMWVLLIIDVTVTSNQTSVQPAVLAGTLRDERGRDANAIGFVEGAGGDAIRATYGAASQLIDYRPGIPVTTFHVFKVPADAQRFTIEGGRVGCG